MTNYRRWRVSGGTYFFTVVTLGRRPILTDDAARQSLREAFRIIRARRPFRVEAIVLLPDHLTQFGHCPQATMTTRHAGN